MKKISLFLFFILLFSTYNFAQNDLQIGTSLNGLQRNPNGAFFDYSDPEAVNIKVAIWGYVRYPGKYIIPSYSNVNDLLSYAGGPSTDATLDELRLYRTADDSSQNIIKIQYDDLLFDENITEGPSSPPMQAGDILLVTGKPRYFFKDYLSITLSVVSTLISLSILILNIAK